MPVLLTKPVRATDADYGCWLDSHRGWHISADLVYMTHRLGMTLDQDDVLILATYDTDYGTDLLTLSTGEEVDPIECVSGQGGMADQATEWLNEHVAPEGAYFGFWEGDFMLQTEQWWEDETW